MSVITCPQFLELDQEIIEDFSECLHENVEQIEICINLLDGEHDPELINRLFRDVHSLKGNCRMVFLDPLVETLHDMEEIVADMRQSYKTYHPLYGEFFMAIILRLDAMIQTLLNEQVVDSDAQDCMLELIEEIRLAPVGKDLEILDNALTTLSGFYPHKPADSDNQTSSEPGQTELKSNNLEDNSDLAFFKQLSLQLDELDIFQPGRTQTILSLCLDTNIGLGSPVDEDQLTAAVYLHDIGMTLVPSEILHKPSKLRADEFLKIKEHVTMGAQLLKRIEGWGEAAEIVQQHHEKYDGSGYPSGLQQDAIHPGARIIALADTYHAVTNERVDRSYKKSLFSAVTLINQESGVQFDPIFVDVFNETVRQQFIANKK